MLGSLPISQIKKKQFLEPESSSLDLKKAYKKIAGQNILLEN